MMHEWMQLDYEHDTMTMMDVTPQMAKDALKRNYKSNRRLSTIAGKCYRADMESGRWKWRASAPIRFAKDGTLLDGQNRLSAQVAAQVTIRYWIQTGLDFEDFKMVDNGKSRKTADFILESNKGRRSTTNRIVLMLEKGYAYTHILDGGGGYQETTRAEQLDFYNDNTEAVEAVFYPAHKMYSAAGDVVPFTVMSAFVYSVYASGGDLDEFIDVWGSNGSTGTVRLRELILKEKSRGNTLKKSGILGRLLQVYEDVRDGNPTTKFYGIEARLKRYERYIEDANKWDGDAS